VLLAAVAVDWIGRRATLVVGMLTTGAACCACAALPAGSVSAIAFVALGKAACSAAWTIAYIYAAELVPTSVRSAALAGNNQASRLGGVLAPALVYAGQRACAGVALPFAVGGAATLLVTALLMWLPETRGQRQPDTLAELLDLYGGDSAQYWGSNEHSAGSNAIMPRQPSALQRLLSGLTRTASGSEHYTPAWRAPSANQLPSHGLELHPSGPVMRSESS
jgi:MFS family permease